MNAENTMINISAKLKLDELTSPKIRIGSPRTNPILNIFVPMILPIIISCSFFLAAEMAIAISGVEVPITNIIIVINLS